MSMFKQLCNEFYSNLGLYIWKNIWHRGHKYTIFIMCVENNDFKPSCRIIFMNYQINAEIFWYKFLIMRIISDV